MVLERMRFYPQEVYFHGSGKQPEYVLSIDASSLFADNQVRLITGGADPTARVWVFSEERGNRVTLTAELLGHSQCVNVVRFAPNSGETVASGSDDGQIIIWTYRGQGTVLGSECSTEIFLPVKKLNALDEITGLSFSPCGGFIAASLVRELSIVFDLGNGRHIQRLDGHNARVLGVSWDPKNEFVASVSADRTVRVYGRAKKKKTAFYPKALIGTVPTGQGNRKLFMSEAHFSADPTAHFFRRLEFSSDGTMLAVPGGLWDSSTPLQSTASSFAVHFFSRSSLSSHAVPTASIPTLQSPAVAVRFHPRRFRTAAGQEHHVFAVVCVHYVAVYRSDKLRPAAVLADVHCTALVDAAWAEYTLAVCSSDGYVSVAVFDMDELGEQVTGVVPTEAPVAMTPDEGEDEEVENDVVAAVMNAVNDDREVKRRRITPEVVNIAF